MNVIANGTVGFTSLLIFSGLLIVGLLAWFIVNRASVRANEQVRLLEALLEEQKRQNQLLKRMADSLSTPEQTTKESDEGKDFIRLIPER